MINIINKQDEAAHPITTLIIDELRLDRSVLLLVPGGSASGVARKVLSSLNDTTANTSRLTVTITDERFGDVGHTDSNWLLYESFSGLLPASQFIPVLRGQDLQQTATSWGQDLSGALTMADTVVALFGIGADGHIAGIKPGTESCNMSDELTIAYTASDFQRVTITPAFFQHIDSLFVYAENSDKRGAIENLGSAISVLVMPAQLIKASKSFFVYYKNN
jgi:6-phosphogluconolactonase/glucosamine-6-phosphate isomerase/deaminase